MSVSQHVSTAVSRRRMLGLSAAAVAATAACGFPASAAAAAVPRPAPRSPDEALARLMEGNARFVAGRTTEPNRTMDRVAALAEGQTPFASILSCADSRVPVELVFDQGFGDLFVCRAAGNIVTPEIAGSLEFGTAVLGSQVLMVLGHTACGAVKAAIAGGPVPGQISTLYQHIHPAVEAAGPDVEATVEANVRVQADLLREASPVVRELMEAGRLRVVGGVYELATGRVRLL